MTVREEHDQLNKFWISPGRWISTDDLGDGLILEDRGETLLVKFDHVTIEIDIDSEYQWTDARDFSGSEMVYDY